MGKPIQSNALDGLYRSLGLSGGVAPGVTILDDGTVSQTLDIGQVVRRSRTPGVTAGWYYGVLENDHPAAGMVESTLDPYNAGAAAIAPFPAVISGALGLDFWLLSASVRRVAGVGALDGGVLYLDAVGTQQAWGIDDSGVPSAGLQDIPVARWTALDNTTGHAHGISGNGDAMVKIGLRVAQPSSIRFRSDATDAAMIRCVMVCGLFPAGLGQDVSAP